jgi:tetraacyldisaccharide 4'-kinase
MQPPKFWYPKRRGRVPFEARLLWPFAVLYGAGAGLRQALTRPKAADVPVICIGNLTLGGTGKTPATVALAEILIDMGRKPVILTRGHGGREAGPLLVDPDTHTAADVGDEPLLLARAAPVIVSRDRPAGAALAAAEGADIILMDDGFQNPTLKKDYSIVVVDGRRFLGNGQVFPAGPLRESAYKGLARADAVLIMDGDPETPLPNALEAFRGPKLYAQLEPQVHAALLSGIKVLAFAGIGAPEKFFRTVKSLGARVMGEVYFADHHPYTERDVESLKRRAQELEADLVTTEKDAVRLPPGTTNIAAIPVKAVFTDPAAANELIGAWVSDDKPEPLIARVGEEKRKPSPQHYVEAALFFTLMGFFRLLGLERASALGGWLGRTIGPRVKPANRARQNLKLAMPELSEEQRERVVVQMFDNLGRLMGEYPHLDKFTATGPNAHIEVIGGEIIKRVKAEGHGVVAISGHFANWELIPLAAHLNGINGAGIYRAPNNPFMDDWLVKERIAHTFPSQIPKGPEGGRLIIKAVKAGMDVAMLIDQKMNEGIAVPFFGYPAMTAPAAATLSIRYNMPIIPLRLERVEGTKFRLYVDEPPEIPRTGDLNADIETLCIWLNDYLERAIRKNPGQWLWLHQRWGKFKNGTLELPKRLRDQAA